MVVDTSVIISIFFNEEFGPWSLDQLEKHRSELRMSTVNLAEALILVEDRQPQLAQRITDKILSAGIRFVPPTVAHARVAAQARIRYPLNLGDCFAYALAKEEGTALLTLDDDFRHTDISVLLPR